MASMDSHHRDAQDTTPFDDYMPEENAGFGSFMDDAQTTNAGRAQGALGASSLGIDEEVEVSKRARAPRVKLNDSLLLSDRGIPALRKRARVLKIKGKGHEFTDTYRLLSMYQLWLDDLFPKARFADALAMVEKEGHKTIMHKMRTEWINESKPRDVVAEANASPADAALSGASASVATVPISNSEADKGKGKALDDIPDDLFGDDYELDMMMAASTRPPVGAGDEVPDEDELDAMMSMAVEMHGDLPDRPPPSYEPPEDWPPMDKPPFKTRPVQTPLAKPAAKESANEEGDDLDAFMEEARNAV